MTAKQYLRQLADYEQKIKRLTEELEERRTRLTSSAAPVLGEKVQSSPKADAFAQAVAIIADKDNERTEKIIAYEILRDRIVDQVFELENINQREVLLQRYVYGRSLQEIAEAMAYSYYRTCHIHGEALIAFSRRWLEH